MDRELLEWAAKAAGWVSWDWLAGDGVLNVYDAEGRHAQFNPLTDDGDALRLAVKLKLEIGFGVINEVYAFRRKSATAGLAQSLDDDPYAATRRCIVRAAAEIGKSGSAGGGV